MKDSKGQYTSHTVHTKCRVVKLPRSTVSGLSVLAGNLTFTRKNSVNNKLWDKYTSCTFEVNLQGAFVLLVGNGNITLQPEYVITFEKRRIMMIEFKNVNLRIRDFTIQRMTGSLNLCVNFPSSTESNPHAYSPNAPKR